MLRGRVGAGSIGAAGPASDAGPGTDFYAVASNRVSITPLQIDLTHPQQIPAVREWLRTSLLAGTAADVRMKLSGKLAEFPFADGKSGQFQVTMKAHGVTIDYAPRWPPLTDVDADLRFEGTKMLVDAHRGRSVA